jgi:phospholipid transport system substrate-binding protein
MTRRFPILGAIAIVLGLVAAAPRSDAAADPRIDARAFVNNLGTEGIQTLGPQVTTQERVSRFYKLFQSDFDVNGIGRFAIGRYWQALSLEQQQEFQRLFQDYTVHAYADKLGKFGGGQFRVTGSEPSADGVVVHSDVMRTGGQPVHIDWHLISAGDGYKVSDVYVDQVSMKVTQRDEFAKIIQNNGGQPSALLAVMREELRKDDPALPVSPPIPTR